MELLFLWTPCNISITPCQKRVHFSCCRLRMMSAGKHGNFPKQGEVCVAGVVTGLWGGVGGWLRKAHTLFSAFVDPEPCHCIICTFSIALHASYKRVQLQFNVMVHCDFSYCFLIITIFLNYSQHLLV